MHPAYFETHFMVENPKVDWPPEFAIITAYATTGESWTDARNLKEDQSLEKQLRDASTLIRRITGYSPITGHAEPGWAAETDWQQACDIGRDCHQDAVYFVTGDDLWVSFCDSQRSLVRVGNFRDRLTSTIIRRSP